MNFTLFSYVESIYYLNILRQTYLFSWYTPEIIRDNFYFLISNVHRNVIRKISDYINYLTCAFKLSDESLS